MLPAAHATTRHARRPRAAAAAVLSALICVIALALTPTAGAASPGHGAPRVGSCHTYSHRAYFAMTETSRATSCGKPHDARVIAVAHMVKGTTYQNLTAKNWRVVERTCYPALWRALGGSMDKRLRSAYGLAWYAPTKRQFAAGARWLRCDVVLPGRSTMLKLPRTTKPFLDGAALTRRTRSCIDPTSSSGYYSCSTPYMMAATSTHQVPGKKFPGDAKLIRMANRRCPGLSNGTGWTSRPDQILWHLGDHRIVCYSEK
jgi:hypothetical protein